jgi:trk system potassium uptake protein TrkA
MMAMHRVLVVGAGKVGFHLAKLLRESGYEVSVLDRDHGACLKVAEELDALAIMGDGTEIEPLGEAGAGKADYIVAATGKDEDNVAVCRIAKSRYACPRTIARVIDPANEALYRLAGADAIIDATSLAARMIRDALPAEGMRLLSIFESGDFALAELELDGSSPAAGRSVSELRLPGDCVLIALTRGGTVLLTRGGTLLAAGDRVFALANRKSMSGLRKALIGSAT